MLDLYPLVRHLTPMPSLLRDALSSGHVRRTVRQDGREAYWIGPHCPNREAVRTAVQAYVKRELLTLSVAGAAAGSVLIGALAAVGVWLFT